LGPHPPNPKPDTFQLRRPERSRYYPLAGTHNLDKVVLLFLQVSYRCSMPSLVWIYYAHPKGRDGDTASQT
jgi:hypothetical protein